MTGIPFHPLANLFPLIEGEDFKALVADVREKDVQDEIVMLDGQILDGRNRYRAALAAGRMDEHTNPKEDCRFVPFGSDHIGTFFPDDILARGPLEFVLSKNLTRRHLNEAQRAMVGARLAPLRRGRPRTITEPETAVTGLSEAQTSSVRDTPAQTEASGQKNNPHDYNPPIGGITANAAAQRLNISPRSIDRARKVQRDGDAALIAAVDRGRLSVDAAYQACRLPVEQQQDIAEAAQAGKANVVRSVTKKAARAEREKVLGAKQRALPNKRFGVIYADPEWRFAVRSRETGLDRAADNHYPTSSLEDICARPIGDIAADDCVLFLWATGPMIGEALQVMQAWGFQYASQCIWRKIRPGKQRGSGYWFTGEHELLLVGTRGHVPAPAPGQNWTSVIDGAVGQHSEKPDIFYELIEAYFPHLPKIELNARRARAGWDAWGLEAPDGDDARDDGMGGAEVVAATEQALGLPKGDLAAAPSAKGGVA